MRKFIAMIITMLGIAVLVSCNKDEYTYPKFYSIPNNLKVSTFDYLCSEVHIEWTMNNGRKDSCTTTVTQSYGETYTSHKEIIYFVLNGKIGTTKVGFYQEDKPCIIMCVDSTRKMILSAKPYFPSGTSEGMIWGGSGNFEVGVLETSNCITVFENGLGSPVDDKVMSLKVIITKK